MKSLSLFFTTGLLLAFGSSLSAQTEVVGALPGEVVVDSFGRANYEIPIAVPPGTAGMEPELSLVYNSGSGNGLLGVGWSLGGLSTITVGPRTLIHDGEVRGIKLDGQDPFYLDGQRLIHINGDSNGDGDTDDPNEVAHAAVGARYRTEVDSFADVQIVASGSDLDGDTNTTDYHFQVRTKDGLIMTYGGQWDSQVMLGDGSVGGVGKCFTWAIERIADTASNYMDFAYDNYAYVNESLSGAVDRCGEGGEMNVYRLEAIEYTGHFATSTAPYAKVEYVYQTRSQAAAGTSDLTTTYLQGFAMKSTHALKAIVVTEDTEDTQYVRHYAIKYEKSPGTDRLRVKSIQQLAGDADNRFGTDGVGFVADHKLPETVFSCRTDSGFVFEGEVSNSFNSWDDNEHGHVLDVDGDGVAELVQIETNHGSNWEHMDAIIYETSSYFGSWAISNNPARTIHFGCWRDKPYAFADIDGDGVVELLYTCSSPETAPHTLSLRAVSLSPAGQYQTATIIGSIDSPAGWQDTNDIQVGDVDGDGRQEAIVAAEITGASNRLILFGVDDSSGDTPGPATVLWNNEWYAGDSVVRSMADFNGDGRDDILLHWEDSGRKFRIFEINPLRADKYTLLHEGRYTVGQSPRTILVGDINGDGANDLVYQSKINLRDDYSFFNVYINDGTGVQISQEGRRFYSGSGSTTAYLQDMNEDGLADLVVRHVTHGHLYAYIYKSNGRYFNGMRKLNGEVDGTPSGLKLDFGDGDSNQAYHQVVVPSVGLRGSSSAEIVAIRRTGDSQREIQVRGVKHSQPDLLATIRKGGSHGMKTELEFKPITDSSVYTKGSLASELGSDLYPIQDVQAPIYVVSKMTRETGLFEADGTTPSTRDTLYTYANGRTHLRGKGFLGFQIFESYDVDTRTSQIQVTAQDFPFTGMVLRTENCYWPEPGTGSPSSIMMSRTDNYLYAERVNDSGKGGMNAGETIFPMILKSAQRTWHDRVFDGDTYIDHGEPWSLVTTRNLFDDQTTHNLFDFTTSGKNQIRDQVDQMAAGATPFTNPWRAPPTLPSAPATGFTKVSEGAVVRLDPIDTSDLFINYTQDITIEKGESAVGDTVRVEVIFPTSGPGHDYELLNRDGYTTEGVPYIDLTIGGTAPSQETVTLEYGIFSGFSENGITIALQRAAGFGNEGISSGEEAWDQWVRGNTEVPANISHGNMVWVDVVHGDLESDHKDVQTTTTANLYNDDNSKHHLGRLVWSEVNHEKPNPSVPTLDWSSFSSRDVAPEWGDPNNITRKSAFAYDSTTGLLLNEWVEPDGSPRALAATAEPSANGTRTIHTRDSYGNITATTVKGGHGQERTTSTQYKPGGRFPQYRKNVYDHTEEMDYDSKLGVLNWSEGPNGLRTSWEYDEFARVEKETSFSGLADTLIVETRREYSNLVISKPVSVPEAEEGATGPGSVSDQLEPQYAWTVVITTSEDKQPESRVYADRLGREIRSASEHPDGTHWVLVDTFYNDLGQVIAVSDPFKSTTPDTTATSASTWAWSTSKYDYLGRPTYAYSANGGRSHLVYYLGKMSSELGTEVWRPATSSYANYKTEGSAPGVRQRTLSYANLQGEAFWIRDNNDPEGIIQHQFDAVGNLVETFRRVNGVGVLGGKTLIRFDNFGRKVWMDDMDMGIWTYKYDPFGQLIEQEDANGKVTKMEYDKLGRLKRRTTDATGTPEYTHWYYYGKANGEDSHIIQDAANGRIGELAAVQMGSVAVPGVSDHQNARYRQSYYFDSYKRPCMTLTKIDSQYYYTYTRFDQYHRTQFVDYLWRPTGNESISSPSWQSFGLKYSYNDFSFNTSVTDRMGNEWWSGSAADVDDYGSLTTYQYGNGVDTTVAYDDNRTQITTTASAPGVDVQTYVADFDVLGNLVSRSSTYDGTTKTETFSYDELNRVDTATVAGGDTLTHGFDYFGRIVSRTRSDGSTVIGSTQFDTYSPTGTQSVHMRNRLKTYQADDDRDGTPTSFEIWYDGNGNMTDRMRDSVGGPTQAGSDTNERWHAKWTAFNKMESIRRWDPLKAEQNKVEFTYDAGFQRITEITHNNETSSNSTRTKQVYHGALEQFWEESAAGSDHYELAYTKVYISTPVGVVGVFTADRNATAATDNTRQYFHYDHLGSITAITDDALPQLGQTAEVVERMAFSVWGERRDPTDWSELAVGESYEDRYDVTEAQGEEGTKNIAAEEFAQKRTDRGFTGHEMMDGVHLVNMNGRIFDPLLGLFLSADPFIQFAENLQNYNRYSYVLNNPASFTDPSGHFLFIPFAIGAAIGGAIGAGLGATSIFAIAGAAFMGGMIAIGAYQAYQAGGMRGLVQFALITGATIAVTAGIGSFFNTLKDVAVAAGNTGIMPFIELARASAHGIVGGAVNAIQGGDFGNGFAASFVGAAIGHGPVGAVKGSSPAHVMLRTTIAAIAGGTASKIGGGKFVNGAATAGIQHLFNAESDVWLEGKNPNPPDEIDVSMEYGNGVEELKKITDWQPGDTVIVSGDKAAFGEWAESPTRAWKDADHQAAHEEMFIIHPNGDVSNVGYSHNGVNGLDRNFIGDDFIADYRFDSTALKFQGRDVTGQFYKAVTDLSSSQFTADRYRVVSIPMGSNFGRYVPPKIVPENNCQTFCTTMRSKARGF